MCFSFIYTYLIKNVFYQRLDGQEALLKLFHYKQDVVVCQEEGERKKNAEPPKIRIQVKTTETESLSQSVTGCFPHQYQPSFSPRLKCLGQARLLAWLYLRQAGPEIRTHSGRITLSPKSSFILWNTLTFLSSKWWLVASLKGACYADKLLLYLRILKISGMALLNFDTH